MVDTQEFLKEWGSRIGRIVDKKDRLYFEVANDQILEVARYLFRTMGCRLSTATAMETRRGLEVLYHFSHDATGRYFCPRVVIADTAAPRAPSITPVVPGAEWIEREMAELLGIQFDGHPRPEKLLTRRHPGGLDRPLRLRRQP